MVCGWARYTDIRVGTPNVEEDMISHDITPQDCRLREMTYSAPIVRRLGSPSPPAAAAGPA